MALTGAAQRLGNASDFGIQEASPRGCSAFDENLYVLGANRLILMSNLAAGEGEYVSQTLTNDSNIQLFNLGALGEHDGRLYLTDGSDLYVFGDPFRGVFGTADASVDFVGDLNDAGDTLLPKGLASDGTNLHCIYDGGRTASDIYSINVTDATKTLVGTIAWPSGLTGPRPLGLFYYDDAFHVVERSEGNLYQLSDPDPTNNNAMTATRVGTATQFDVSESVPTGCGVFGGSAHLVGSGNDAIYRFIDSDDPDPPAETDAVLDITVSPANVQTSGIATVTFTFDKAVSGFSAADITISAGAKGALSGSGASYTMPVTAPSSGSGTLTISIAADAVSPGNNADSVSFTYAEPVPVLSFGSETIANQSGVVGTAVDLILPEATGGIGTRTYSLSPSLPAGLNFNSVTRRITGTPTGRFTSATFTYTATDGNDDTVELTFTIVVTAPAITFASTIANQIWTVGTAVNLILPAGAGGVGDLTPTLIGTLPQGITFTASTRALAGNPSAVFSVMIFSYTLTDAEGISASITFTIVVNAAAVAFGAAWANVPAGEVDNTFEVELHLDVPVSGLEPGDFRLRTAGVTFLTPSNSNTTITAIAGTNNYRIAFDLAGTFDRDCVIRFIRNAIAYDGSTYPADPIDSSEFRIVTPTALSFGAGTIANQAWVVGTAVNLTLPAASGGTGAIAYSLSPSTPAGISFTALTRVLAGTPTGRFTSATFTYTAEDADGTTVELTFTIAVAAAAVALSFGAGTIANQAWVVGTAVNLTLPQASGGTGAIAYSLSPSTPAGMSFTNATRVLAGTPTGRFTSTTFTYTATAGSESVSLTFAIIVTATAITFASTVENQIYEINTAIATLTLPSASGGVGTLTYSLSPTLPTGLSRSNFAISGTPTEAYALATFTWRVTDTEGVSATLQFSVRVLAELADPHPITVLPETSALLEKALVDTYIERQTDVLELEDEIPIRHLWNPDTCPAALLPYLACAMSVAGTAVDFSETQLRTLIRDSYELHIRKGTIQALKDVIASLGYRLNRIEEGVASSPAVPATDWARYRLVMDSALSIANGRALEKLIEGAAPVSRELVEITYDQANAYDGTLRYDGTHAYGRITTP